MNTIHYYVESADIERLAKEFLLAKTNTERAYEHSGAGELFHKYGTRMGEAYLTLARAIGLEKAYSVDASQTRMRTMKIEWMEHRVTLSVPEGMVPGHAGLKTVSSDVYATLRRKAVNVMLGRPESPGARRWLS